MNSPDPKLRSSPGSTSGSRSHRVSLVMPGRGCIPAARRLVPPGTERLDVLVSFEWHVEPGPFLLTVHDRPPPCVRAAGCGLPGFGFGFPACGVFGKPRRGGYFGGGGCKMASRSRGRSVGQASPSSCISWSSAGMMTAFRSSRACWTVSCAAARRATHAGGSAGSARAGARGGAVRRRWVAAGWRMSRLPVLPISSRSTSWRPSCRPDRARHPQNDRRPVIRGQAGQGFAQRLVQFRSSSRREGSSGRWREPAGPLRRWMRWPVGGNSSPVKEVVQFACTLVASAGHLLMMVLGWRTAGSVVHDPELAVSLAP